MKTTLFYMVVLQWVFFVFGVSQHQTHFDDFRVSTETVQNNLKDIDSLSTRDSLTCKQILLLYRAEINIGKYIQSFPPDMDDSQFPYSFKLNGFNRDSSTVLKCLTYLRNNRIRFREVEDEYKGEENSWEPTRYWFCKSEKICADCIETLEMDCDIDFKDFIRQFDIHLNPKPTSCEKYYEDILKYSEAHKEAYSEEEIKQWVPDCIKKRAEFVSGRNKLLKKYGNTFLTKTLREIDERSIVIFKEAGC